jgi:formate C-acetyltransferase
MGTELTREGLGFPQYSNDDVVIPGLIAWDTTPRMPSTTSSPPVEFIIPGKGMDVANIGPFRFPA